MARFTDDYLLYLLAQASGRTSASFHEKLSDQGIAVSTWRIVASLYPDAPASVGELAEACLAKQPTMTRQIDRLVTAGVVERRASHEDRRRVVVKLTAQGRELGARLTKMAQEDEARVLAGYDANRVREVKEVLRGLLTT